MARVEFTQHLEQHVEAPERDVAGDTVGEVLEAVFAGNPRLRGYVLDDQGRLRKHVVVFIDGRIAADRAGLTDAVEATSEVFVMQALSGG